MELIEGELRLAVMGQGKTFNLRGKIRSCSVSFMVAICDG